MRTRFMLFLIMMLFSGFVSPQTELDVRLDKIEEDFQVLLQKEKEKLAQEKEKTRKFLAELRSLTQKVSSFDENAAEMLAHAMQPLSELAEEDTVKLAYWYVARDYMPTIGGIKKFATDYTEYYTGGGGLATGRKYTGTSGYSYNESRNNAAAQTVNSPPDPTIPKVYSYTYLGYTATSNLSDKDAQDKAIAMYNAANPTYSATVNGYTATSTVSQAAADAAARNNWLNAKLPSGALLEKETYATFGWKNFSATKNFELKFRAVASNDITIGLQYSSSQCVEIVLGGWSNSESRVRDCTYNSLGTSSVSDVRTTGPASGTPVPDTVNYVDYVLTVRNGVLTIDATKTNGVTTRVVTSSSTLFNKTFTGYAFRAWSIYSWRVANITVRPLEFTSTYNGITKTSTTSQADADTQAQQAWQEVENNTVAPVANAFNTAQQAYVNELAAAKTMINELIDLFKADPVSSYSVASWVKV